MLITILIYLLLSNAVTLRQEKSILLSRTAIIGLLLVSYLVWNSLYINPLGKGIGIYGGLFHVTTFTHTFNIFILLISATILTLNSFYPRKIYIKDISSMFYLFKSKQELLYNKQEISNTNGEQFRIIEYPLIIIFIICGALFLISTNDLISIFLSIELQSYGLYIISTLYRDSEYATASGLTYFLLGGLSSCFILLGSALLYVNSGTTNLENIYIITNLSDLFSTSPMSLDLNTLSSNNSLVSGFWYQPYYLYLSLIVMSVGFLFKVSAAPFHFWSPDVYDGIPTIVTTYVAIIAKISIFAFLLEFLHYTEYDVFGFNWKNILLLSSFISLIVGSVLGLTQFRIKRLFAYSTINHVGFILFALSINTAESIQAFIFYILQYTLSNLNAFMILVTIGFSFYGFTQKDKTRVDRENNNKLMDKRNSPVQLISQIRGYFKLNPFIAISLGITLFSFAGIPPLIGFFGKQMILSAALDNGYVFMSLIAILTSVISAAYYLNLIKEVFFFESDSKRNPNSKLIAYLAPVKYELHDLYKKINININMNNIVLSSSLSSVISVITLLLMLFIYMPEEWFNIVSILSLITFKS